MKMTRKVPAIALALAVPAGMISAPVANAAEDAPTTHEVSVNLGSAAANSDVRLLDGSNKEVDSVVADGSGKVTFNYDLGDVESENLSIEVDGQVVKVTGAGCVAKLAAAADEAPAPETPGDETPGDETPGDETPGDVTDPGAGTGGGGLLSGLLGGDGILGSIFNSITGLLGGGDGGGILSNLLGGLLGGGDGGLLSGITDLFSGLLGGLTGGEGGGGLLSGITDIIGNLFQGGGLGDLFSNLLGSLTGALGGLTGASGETAVEADGTTNVDVPEAAPVTDETKEIVKELTPEEKAVAQDLANLAQGNIPQDVLDNTIKELSDATGIAEDATIADLAKYDVSDAKEILDMVKAPDTVDRISEANPDVDKAKLQADLDKVAEVFEGAIAEASANGSDTVQLDKEDFIKLGADEQLVESSVLAGLAGMLGPVLAGAIPVIGAALPAIAGVALPLISAALPAIGSAILPLISSLFSGEGGPLGSLGGIIQPIIDIITGAISPDSPIMGALLPLIEPILPLFRPIAKLIDPLFADAGGPGSFLASIFPPLAPLAPTLDSLWAKIMGTKADDLTPEDIADEIGKDTTPNDLIEDVIPDDTAETPAEPTEKQLDVNFDESGLSFVLDNGATVECDVQTEAVAQDEDKKDEDKVDDSKPAPAPAAPISSPSVATPGPKVNTGGDVASKSFFEKIAAVFS